MVEVIEGVGRGRWDVCVEEDGCRRRRPVESQYRFNSGDEEENAQGIFCEMVGRTWRVVLLRVWPRQC